jgi:biopolymer transport protein ExbD
MTPMVDLGFLLITFFMLTTTLAKPVTMQLSMPDKTETKETSPVKASETLTVLPDENKVYYYQGKPGDATTVVQVTDYSDQGIRQVLFRLKSKSDKTSLSLSKLLKVLSIKTWWICSMSVQLLITSVMLFLKSLLLMRKW